MILIGGTAGIGLETARLARSEGADVILTARDPERLGRVAAEVMAKDSSTTQIVELITAGRSGDIGLAPATADENI